MMPTWLFLTLAVVTLVSMCGCLLLVYLHKPTESADDSSKKMSYRPTPDTVALMGVTLITGLMLVLGVAVSLFAGNTVNDLSKLLVPGN